MIKKTGYAPFFLLSLLVNPPLFAHTLQEAEAELHERAKYAQFVDRPAPEFTLADASGHAVSLADFTDKVVVLNFIYTRCANACPLHMNLLAEVQEKVQEAGLRDEVEFVTIATDDEDIAGTRANMQAYGNNFGLEASNWRFLYRHENEPAGTTRQLAEAYGLRFDPVAEGVQAHGVVTHVIDPTGQMRARFHGLKFEPEHLVSYVKVLVEGPEAFSDGVWDSLQHYIGNMTG